MRIVSSVVGKLIPKNFFKGSSKKCFEKGGLFKGQQSFVCTYFETFVGKEIFYYFLINPGKFLKGKAVVKDNIYKALVVTCNGDWFLWINWFTKHEYAYFVLGPC